jgi:hypothetical protein
VHSQAVPNHQLTALPQQRAATTTTSPSPYERGACGMGRIHAARKTLQGTRAVCDGALPLTRLGGRFDHEALDSCLACIVETTDRTITLS